MATAVLRPVSAFNGSNVQLTKPEVVPITRSIVSSGAGAIALALGVSTFFGWVFDISILKTAWPGLVSMPANTAICFVLLGVALLLPRLASVLAPCAVAAIGLLTLAEYLGLKLGLDQLFFRDGDPLSVNAPGRPSVNTTVVLLFITAALLLARHGGRWALVSQMTALVAGTVAWLAVLGYTSGTKELYGLPGRAPIAVHTAVGFIVVAVGVLALRPEVGAIKLLMSKTAAGSLLRRLAPVLILGPALLSWVRHLSTHGDHYAGQWLFVSGLIGLIVIALVTTARTVGRTESALELAESAKRKNEQDLDRFFTLSLELLCIADNEGNLQRVNPAWEETLGWTIDDLAKKPFVELVHPDDREMTLRAIEENAAGSAALVAEFENRYLCKDGSYRWFQWGTAAAPDQNVIYAAGRDISERKDAEAALRKLAEELEERFAARTADLSAANEELEAFAYSVSHDLRAPLRGIDGFSQAVLEEYSESLDETGRDYLVRLRSASQRMGHLIDDMLSLSRVSRFELSREQMDLSAIATSLAVELQEREPDREVEFVIHDGVTALGDFRFLSIVLENLLANAFKFTSKSATARIEFGRKLIDGESAYFVRDDGVGFDMAYAEQLFVPFQRLHTATDFPGSGIGLATIRRIIVRHGGRVWAHGEIGRGATMYFTLGEVDEGH
jgi:PAS domain S-box-containing protein